MAARDSAGAALPPLAAAGVEQPLADHHWAGSWWRQGAAWPPGHWEEPRRRTAWHERSREHIAGKRLAAIVAAARVLMPDTPPPRGQHILVAVPVCGRTPAIDGLLDALGRLEHPKRSMSLAFLASGGADEDFRRLTAFARAHAGRYAAISLRRSHLPAALAPRGPVRERARRAHLARMRNRLLRQALGDEDWVLWLEPDAAALPPDLVRNLIAANARAVQPNAVREPGGPTIDTRCWLSETTLDDESMRPYWRDGLYLPPTGYARLYPSDLRYRDRMSLDGVGGRALLVDAALHRAGVLFPETPYRGLIDTEGFGAILRDHGIEVVGLPNVDVLHAAA